MKPYIIRSHYDQLDRIIEKIYRRGDETIERVEKYENALLVEVTFFDAEEMPVKRKIYTNSIYTYFIELVGTLIQKKTDVIANTYSLYFYNDDKSLSFIDYYSASNVKIKTEYYADTIMLTYSLYEYSSTNLLLKEFNYDTDDVMQHFYRFYYNSLSILTKKIAENGNGEIIIVEHFANKILVKTEFLAKNLLDYANIYDPLTGDFIESIDYEYRTQDQDNDLLVASYKKQNAKLYKKLYKLNQDIIYQVDYLYDRDSVTLLDTDYLIQINYTESLTGDLLGQDNYYYPDSGNRGNYTLEETRELKDPLGRLVLLRTIASYIGNNLVTVEIFEYEGDAIIERKLYEKNAKTSVHTFGYSYNTTILFSDRFLFESLYLREKRQYNSDQLLCKRETFNGDLLVEMTLYYYDRLLLNRLDKYEGNELSERLFYERSGEVTHHLYFEDDRIKETYSYEY